MNMNLYMPEIFWHDRKGILSIDVQQQCLTKEERQKYGFDNSMLKQLGSYKIATASVQREIRIWEFHFDHNKCDNLLNAVPRLTVNFVANLEGHECTTNVVRFSPNGKYLASGDVQGALIIWKVSVRDDDGILPVEKPSDDFPPNRENWVRAFRVPIRHFGDVTYICWSPDSSKIVSVATDDTISLHKADSGKQMWTVRSFRHYANGIAWDPRGKYLITLSTDRRLDILEAAKGTCLRTCHRVELPSFMIGAIDNVGQEEYKIFHDDQLISFMRGIDFSPCGSLVFAPAGHLEVRDRNFYGSFVFRRSDFDKCRPFAMIPSTKPTFMVKCSPVFYELRKDVKENYLGLPYRIIFAVLSKEMVVFYDSQYSKFFAYADNLQLDQLTNIAWTPDGKVMVVSSLEGYNSFLTFPNDMLGEPCAEQDYEKLLQSFATGGGDDTGNKPAAIASQAIPADENQPSKPFEYPDSPCLIQPKKSHKKKEFSFAIDIIGTASSTPAAIAASSASDAATSLSVAFADGTISTNDFKIVKRRVPASSESSGLRGAKRKKEADGTPTITSEEPSSDDSPKSFGIQRKLHDMW